MKDKAKTKIPNILFSVVLTTVMVAMLVAITFSWYTMRNYDVVDTVKISSSTFTDLKIITEEDVVDSAVFSFPDKKLGEICGDGEKFFHPSEFDFYGKEITVDGKKMFSPVATAYEAESTESANEKIITLDFKVRCSLLTTDLYISPESYVAAADLTANSLAASACVRVAIFYKTPTDTDYVKKCVWIPNSAYQAVYNDGYGLNIDQNGKVETSYAFMHDLDDATTITTAGKQNGKKTVDGVDYIWGDIPENYVLCELTPSMLDIRVVMWIDGEDRECISSLLTSEKENQGEKTWVNGKVSLSLTLAIKED